VITYDNGEAPFFNSSSVLPKDTAHGLKKRAGEYQTAPIENATIDESKTAR
jgi:hypothetical protein